jgi:cytochrome c553
MAAQVESLSEADMADLAAWYAAQKGLYVKR